MRLLNTLRGRYLRGLLNHQSPLNGHNTLVLLSSASSNSIQNSFLYSISRRTLSVAPQSTTSTEENCHQCREPRSLFFEGGVKLSEKIERSANPNSKEKLRNSEDTNNRIYATGDPLNKNCFSSGGNRFKRGLWVFFGGEKENLKFVKPTDCGNEEPNVIKDLSADMQLLTHHLYMEGYLKGATFLPENRFDLKMFEVSYAREFLKFAAAKFGRDRQCIVKWLSSSDLKKIALFGCPSLGKKSIHAAKHMRNFLGIKEHKVCQNCSLKHSCKLANRRPLKDSTRLHLASVMRVLVMYALESVPERLAVPEEIKDSVSRLLKEIVKLSHAAY